MLLILHNGSVVCQFFIIFFLFLLQFFAYYLDPSELSALVALICNVKFSCLQERVLSALDGAGLFLSCSLTKDKVLFCSTDVGRTSFVRQLEPDWHVDSNLEIVSQLARFIRCQLHISELELGQIASNVFTSKSLEQYFACL
ncbi:uncharacterized protein A4U43_UnF5040 [Asparagus officinalis]|uniref:Uncharacterized protein n=2 Tax=Asparagus officinalis TaxID=4686 RepID=A0A1R3L6T2_ASPOF|nr:uncharacterized protein A4U43_UnF5040 [Asparagus officinalis]